ncbi:MAG: AraC family transcriptional regulator [Marinifilaceae bacterium]|nr:AraC family transcriptional regulator [Marinifilaceae bacterium]
MSRINLENHELEEIISGKYFIDKLRSNGYPNKKYSAKYGVFKYKIANYNNICISENNFSIPEDICLTGPVEQEIICLTFMLNGYSSYSCGSFKETKLDNNSFNLFYINDEQKSKTKCKKSTHNKLVEIFMDSKIFFDLIERHKVQFKTINNKFKSSKSFTIFDNGIHINSEISRILTNIREAEIYGNFADLYTESKLLELFTQMLMIDDKKLVVNSNSMNNKMQEAKYILESNYKSPPCLNQLAKDLGICSTSLKKNFKSTFNSSILTHIIKYRMSKAADMLIYDKQKSIFDIAIDLGYEHQSNFSIAFKKIHGKTPNEYRKSNII